MKSGPFQGSAAESGFGEDSPETWIKSSLSYGSGDCVEVTSLPGKVIGVRHSKDRKGSILRFTPAEWDAFLGGVRLGEFDRFSAGR